VDSSLAEFVDKIFVLVDMVVMVVVVVVDTVVAEDRNAVVDSLSYLISADL